LPRLIARDAAVRVMVRDPDRLPPEIRPHVEIVRGELGDREAADRATAGATRVLHLAALATAGVRDTAAYHRLNAGAVQILLEAAARHGVARFVHVSSVAALPPVRPARARGLPRRPTEYGRSKTASEQAVARYMAAGNDAVIVRPTRVYGPGPWNDANGTTRLAAMYLKGQMRIRLRDGDVEANYVHVDDVARGIELAADRGRCGAAYMLGGENATLQHYFALIAEITGVRRVVVPVPPQVVLPVACLGAMWCRLGGHASVTPSWLNNFLEHRPVDIGPARADLGYDPLPLREGLRRTLAWLKTVEKGPWHVPVELFN
jgi:farnesol dehydrogenase